MIFHFQLVFANEACYRLGQTFQAKKIHNNFFNFVLKLSVYAEAYPSLSLNLVVLFCDGPNIILLNIEQTRTSFFEHQTDSNVFNYW